MIKCDTEHLPPASAVADIEALTQALSAPFDPREVKFKPAVVTGNRALALAYVDARVIQDRLDDVLGVSGWQDEYECMPDGSVVCRLHLRFGDEWITKMDVGGMSEQPDEGDRRKAAFSDALKRTAVKFGIGRYLYRLPTQWCDFDPHKKQFTRTPTLPPSALPPKATKPALPAMNEAPKALPAKPVGGSAKLSVPPAKPSAPARSAPSLPANGAELQRRLYEYDARLAKKGLCQPGELVKHVVSAGVNAGYDADLAAWNGPAIALAVEETRAFESRVTQLPAKKEVA
jgi:hypothetical protein